MIVDLSKIPSTCRFVLSSNNLGADYFFWVLRECGEIQFGYGRTPQEAVDEAVRHLKGDGLK